MTTSVFSPQQARELHGRISSLEDAALALGDFAEREPALASAAGVEVAAAEARTILGCAICGSVGSALRRSYSTGEPTRIAWADLDQVSRLSGVVALADARLGAHESSLAAVEKAAPGLRVESVLGIAGTIIGIVKAIT